MLSRFNGLPGSQLRMYQWLVLLDIFPLVVSSLSGRLILIKIRTSNELLIQLAALSLRVDALSSCR